MNKTVFFTREWPGPAAKTLEEAGFEVDIWPDFNRPPADVLVDRIERGVYAIVTTVEDPITSEILLDGRRGLAIVAQSGVGYDNIETDVMSSAGIWVTNTPGVLDDATADLAFALMCALARQVPEADRYVRAGEWSCWHPSLLLGKELAGATVGIVGMGRIGLAFARRCAGFDMKILYNARSRKPEAEALGASFCSLEDLLAEAEIVSLHVPLTPETENLMDDNRIGLMRTDALLINTARGAVVDQEALRRALVDGRIMGAALDVTNPEPLPADDPLLTAPNLIVAPHIGSAGIKTRERMALMAAQNIIALSSGQRPPNVVADPTAQATR